ncbi:MAG: hypothetical protein HQL03_08630 [Nitrospirae bacterium]|nr:hypothetical protein [Nitrospirota bacterium]MBF0592628.1 hypothetical protein [Nitrospirota bacterium]
MAEDVCIFSANAIRAKVILHALQQGGISAVLSANRPMNYRLSIYGSDGNDSFRPTILPRVVIIDAYSYTHAELKAFKQAASDVFANMHVIILKTPYDNRDIDVQCASIDLCDPIPIDPDLIVSKVKALMDLRDTGQSQPPKEDDTLLDNLRGFLNLK